MDTSANGEIKVSLNDHDLLVVLHTQMQRVLLDLKEVKDQTIGRISVLESSVVYKKDAELEATRILTLAKSDAESIFGTKSDTSEDFETRLRSLEKTQAQTLTWGTVSILAIGVAEFLVIHFVK